MPNYRAVSPEEIPPLSTLKQAFKIAAQNSCDYSSFLFAGFTSAITERDGVHTRLGSGLTGFREYYWRGCR